MNEILCLPDGGQRSEQCLLELTESHCPTSFSWTLQQAHNQINNFVIVLPCCCVSCYMCSLSLNKPIRQSKYQEANREHTYTDSVQSVSAWPCLAAL